MEGFSRAGQRASSVLSGIMDVRTGPPRLVSTLKTYYHPVSKKTVVLHPLPNAASPKYFRRVLSPLTLLVPPPLSGCEGHPHPPDSTVRNNTNNHNNNHNTPSWSSEKKSSVGTADPPIPSSMDASSTHESTPTDNNNSSTLISSSSFSLSSTQGREKEVGVGEGFDTILCEDGQLPFSSDSPRAYWQKLVQICLPFLLSRPVVPREWGSRHYDGLVQRDSVETRMAFEMLREQWQPPVDPRARRGIERILNTYPDGSRVCVPWSPYHIPYFIYRLELEGFELIKKEEVEVMGFRWLVYGVIGSILFSFYVLGKAIAYFL